MTAGRVLAPCAVSEDRGMPLFDWSTPRRCQSADSAPGVLFTPRTEPMALKKQRPSSIPDASIYHTPAACSDECHAGDATHVTERGCGRVPAWFSVAPGISFRSLLIMFSRVPRWSSTSRRSVWREKKMGRDIEHGHAVSRPLIARLAHPACRTLRSFTAVMGK